MDVKCKEKNIPEAVLVATRNILEVTHATRAGGLAAFCLQAPVVGTDLGGGVAAGRASWGLAIMERDIRI